MKIVLFALLIASLGTVGCASGGGQEPDAGGTMQDSGNLSDRVTSLVDAARDGATIRDSSLLDVTLPAIDSAIVIPDGGGIFCASTAQCTMAGTCCFSLGGGMGLCVPGTEPVPGVCFPTP